VGGLFLSPQGGQICVCRAGICLGALLGDKLPLFILLYIWFGDEYVF